MFLASHDLQNFHKKVVTMKGVFKCTKFLTFSITLALCSVLFSADTSALILNTEVEPTGNFYPASSNFTGYLNQDFGGTAIQASAAAQIVLPATNLTENNMVLFNKIVANNNFNFVEGNYYVFFIGLRSNTDLMPVFWNKNVGTQFSIIQWTETSFETANTEPRVCDQWKVSGSIYTCNSYSIPNQIQSSNLKWFEVVLRAKESGEYKLTIGNPNNNLTSANLIRYYNYVSEQRIILTDVVEYKSSSAAAALEEQNRRDEEDRDNIESQQESSSTDAGTSADEANQQGTTLLVAFTSFVNALTSATPSNCRINMDLGNLDMGQVDLCQLSPPAGFSALASVFMILFCVPLSIATARKVISLFRSFQ